MVKNPTPLWKSYLFPLLGVAADTALMCVYGLPPLFLGILALAIFVAGCVLTYTNWKATDESTSNLPAIAAAIGPLLVLMYAFGS